MENPVFILGCHKSGTSLLRSLLDGVPEFFAVPAELHFFEFAGFWVDYAIRRSIPIDVNFDDVLLRIERELNPPKEGAQNRDLGGNSLFGDRSWNIDELISYLDRNGRVAYNDNDLKGFIEAYLNASYYSLKGVPPPSSIRYVEKSVENAEFATLLKKIFPKAKFIHIVRNPYATLVSIRKFATRNKRYPYLGNILDAMENSYYHAILNPKVIDDYLVIRYEDLLLDPKTTMLRISEFLGIKFHESMLIPSSFGKGWKGNSTTGLEFDGISTIPIAVWKTDILPIEIDLVNTLLPHVVNEFNYEKVVSRKPIYLPNKGEGLLIYFANRCFQILAKHKRKGKFK